MMSGCLVLFRRLAIAMIVCGALVGWGAGPAEARIFVGIGVPFYGPGYYPPPYYYPPPVYYPPPPIYYAPPLPAYYPPQTYAPPPTYAPPQTYAPSQTYAPPASPSVGQSCHAASYVCPMDRPVAAGSACYCLDNRGQRVTGRAN